MESAICEVSRSDMEGLEQDVKQNSREAGLMKEKFVLALLFPLLLVPLLLGAKKFYDDDPLGKEPTPLRVENAKSRKLNDYYDLFHNTLAKPGERQPKGKKGGNAGFIPAQAVNTLGEVPDNSWFTNRIGSRPMSIKELLKGPGDENGPSMEGKWRITAAKTQGISPGFRIQDSRGNSYYMKFDPVSNPEMATGADVLGSVFFHALGYNVPENYLVTFDEDRLVIGDGTTLVDVGGRKRPMSPRDATEMMLKIPRDAQGRVRGVASYVLKGKFLGEFRYHGTRSDDPNDVVLHEHRRDLRGLFVFCAWLGHDDSRSINTFDSLVEENGLKYIKHYLMDFGSILGSATEKANTARGGNAYFYETKPAFLQLFTLGLYVPRWARVRYRTFPSLGLFDYRTFEPEKWKPEYPNPAYGNRLPDDTFWAAKRVMSFTDEQIRAIVKLANYSDPEAEAWLVKCLIERRNKIGETYFARVLPLDGFRVNGDRLEFEDLQVKYGFMNARDYTVRWSRFDNDSETHAAIAAASSSVLPGEVQSAEMGSYFATTIRGDDQEKTVTVYIRKQRAGYKVVGIERTW